jgi:hypothetical protein
MNPGEFGRRNNRATMASSSSSTSIAKKARSKAETDFATWLMMAKLGSFDDLPSNAQKFLTDYRIRLEKMSEAESTALAVREVYSAYYNEMGGVGEAPEPQARKPTTGSNVAQFKGPPKPQSAPSAARNSIRPMAPKSLRALLIFASLVALVVAYRFLTH